MFNQANVSPIAFYVMILIVLSAIIQAVMKQHKYVINARNHTLKHQQVNAWKRKHLAMTKTAFFAIEDRRLIKNKSAINAAKIINCLKLVLASLIPNIAKILIAISVIMLTKINKCRFVIDV